MGIILFLWIAGAILIGAATLISVSTKEDWLDNLAAGLPGFIGIVVLAVALCVSVIWYKAGLKTVLINKEFNTEYTQSEVFWMGDSIEKVIEGEKLRIFMGNKE